MDGASSTESEPLLHVAKLQHQEYYELLADWTKYNKNEYKYLKQNIGFALFGPPTETCSNDTEKNNMVLYKQNAVTENIDIASALDYEPNAKEVINTIYEKVYEYGEGQVDEDYIYYGIIYNVIILHGVKPKKAESNEKDEKSSKEEQSKEKINEDETNNITALPIFKIRRSVEAKDGKKEANGFDTWYIDTDGRVYKSWTDYKTNNTLPQCTMVLPKDGIYQPDPAYDITEECSTVCVQIENSSACEVLSNICSGIDITSNVLSVAGLGIAVASLATPIAPIVLTGSAITTAVSSLWTIGRSSQNLVDRSLHEETIDPTKSKAALSSWLATVGSAVGLAASGGTALLTRAAQRGNNISSISKSAYNWLVVGNLGINGFGVGYELYSMYKKYQSGKQIETLDVLYLGTHILFFGGSVINLQFASDLITSTQGKVIDDYKATVRSKNLRKKFNRIKRRAAVNNADTISENAEVIRYINKRTNLQCTGNVARTFMSEVDVSFEKGKLFVNGIQLLDPMKFMLHLIKSDLVSSQARHSEEDNSSSAEDSNTFENMFYNLRDVLLNLLTELFSKKESESATFIDIVDFDETLHDMKRSNNSANILPLIFEVAVSLLDSSAFDSTHLVKAVHFIWNYVKENLRLITLNASSTFNDRKVQKVLETIVKSLFEFVDEVIRHLLPAFINYIEHVYKT